MRNQTRILCMTVALLGCGKSEEQKKREAMEQLGQLAKQNMDRYIARAHQSEATLNLSDLSRRLEMYLVETRKVVGSVPMTPSRVPCGEAVMDPPGTWSHPTWVALEYTPTGRHRFSYSIESTPTKVQIHAYGDLDCDGQLSTFTRSIEVLPSGELGEMVNEPPIQPEE